VALHGSRMANTSAFCPENLALPRKALIALVALFAWTAASTAAEKPARTIGWVEPVIVEDGALRLQAKVDTGADISSVNVETLTIERRSGRRWAIFSVRGARGTVHFERPVVRYVRVKRLAGGAQRRPTVRLVLCLADFEASTEVNLVDREHMRYPMLVGRNFMRGRFVVDPARRNTTRPTCARGAK